MYVCCTLHYKRLFSYGGQGFVLMSLYVSLHMRVSVYTMKRCRTLSLSVCISIHVSPLKL